MAKAQVILFKDSGKYYTEEEWTIPTKENWQSDEKGASPVGGDLIGPWAMFWSPDFRRIGGGKVLVVTQEPWGYPHLL